MWLALLDIAKREECSIHDICSLVSIRRAKNSSLTAAIRVFLMLYYQSACTKEGHLQAGHGNFENMKKRAQISKDSNTYFSKEEKVLLTRRKRNRRVSAA